MMSNGETYGSNGPRDAAAAGGPVGGFFPSLLDIFIDPLKVFRRIAAGLSWWKPFIVLCVVGVIITVLNTPLQKHMLEIQYASMSEEQYERVMEAVNKFKFLGYLAIPIFVLLMNSIVAGVAHLVNSVISFRPSFKKTFSLTMFCSFIGVLSQIVGTIVVWARGIENIESVDDFKVSFGAGALVPGLKGFWYALSESLSLFQIWYYVLFVLGTSVIFSMEKKKALITGIAVWAVSFLMLYLQQLLGRGLG
jgi:hypothetical protein